MTRPIFVIPPAPEGYEWASVDLGVEITTSPGGKEFVKTIEDKGIGIIVLPEGGMSAQWYPRQIFDANAVPVHRNGEGGDPDVPAVPPVPPEEAK